MRPATLTSWLIFTLTYFALCYVLDPDTVLGYATILFYSLTIRTVFNLVFARRVATSLVSFIALGLFVASISLVRNLVFTNALMILVLYFVNYVAAYVWLYAHVRGALNEYREQHMSDYWG